MPRVDRPQSVVDEDIPAKDRVVEEPYSSGPDFFDSVWRFFCSTRLALILILIIAAATLAGTMLLQAPEGITADKVEYARWLGKARLKYGIWTDLLSILQLFDVFSSVWFRLLLAGLTMNIVVCTVNRWNGLWRSIAKPRVRMGEGFFRKASHSVVLSGRGADVFSAAAAIRSGLGGLRYRVVETRDEDRVYLYADKNRFGKLGTILNHLSLILILAGAIAGGLLGGFRDKEFMVPVGFERPVGHETGLTLRVDQFIDEYYPEGPPKDYRSDAVLLRDGNEVGRHVIRVNEPMEFNGIRFYQAFFGPAAVLEVKESTGKVIYSDGLPLAWRTNEDRPVGSFSLPDKGIEVYVIAPYAGRADPLVPAGQVRIEIYGFGTQRQTSFDNLVMGRPKQVGDLEFNFVREVQFTGLQVTRDPGTPLIWLASLLMVIGLAMVFYFPHRRIWAVVRSGENGHSQVVLGATARRDMGFEEEFRRVAGCVDDSLKGLSRQAPVAPRL